ncbi:VaFE repeat-containing surface-anchored protein, partial [Listeria grandensis]|uniref:VaFE repeat-containing surface-anchored protein n=1 Tax=Listeria grandensis TaxID=1494963 RepID=UPI00164E9C99
MKTIKRIISILLICSLTVSLLPMQMMASASVSWGTQFITGIDTTDRNGNTISEAPINRSFKVRYDWTIPNSIDVKEGNTMNITLPEGLQTTQNDVMEFKAASGAVVARGQATSPGGKNYNVTFTDYPETHSNVKGYIEFFIQFDSSVQPNQKIEFEALPGKSPVTITAITENEGEGPPGEPGPVEITVDSSYKMRSYQGNGIIEWYIFIIPPKFKSLPADPGYYEPVYNVTLEDSYGVGQTLISDSVKVRQAYGVRGGFYIENRLPELKVTRQDPAARTFGLDLGDLDDGYGREITYRTKITDADQEAFYNEAAIKGDGFERKIESTLRIEGGTGGAEGEQAAFTAIKQDTAGKPLEGASFDLYRISASGGETEIATGLTSDKDGVISYEKLRFGTYELREKSAPEGYKLLDAPYRFALDSSGMNTLAIPIINELEEIPVGSVELSKYDEADKSKGLTGAKFDLYKGTPSAGNIPISSHTTPANGIVAVNNLEFGDYYFVETEAPDGYELDATPRPFTIGEDQVTVPVKLGVANKAIEIPVGSVELIKYDEADKSKVLAGASFDLFRGTPGSGTLVDSHVTPASGTFHVNNLEFGDYYLVETKAPAGYELDATPRPFTIGEDQVTVPFKLGVSNKAIVDPTIQTIAFETGTNSKILFPGEAAAISDRVSYSDLISGKEYRLNATLLTKDGALKLTTGQKQFTAANATGQEVVDLAAFDATALRGQQVVVFEQLIDVASGLIVATHEDLNDADQTVAFADPRGGVEFTKVDADTQNPLAGAEFTLYEGTSGAPGNALGVYTSAATTGKVTVNDLPYGNYHFVETKAPNGGYILDGKPIGFEIVSDAAVLELDNVTNTRDYKPQIETLAFETGTNNKELYPGMATQISDRVTYEQLTPGKNYRLEAKLMTKDGQTVLTQGTKTFTATTENGEEVVELDGFDARALKGQQVVVFERLIDTTTATNAVVATHEDLNDADQTVAFQVPGLQTFAFETNTGLQHDIHPHQNVELSDRVVYTNLNPGERYTLEATLVDKLTGNIVFTQGAQEFIPTETSGEVTVPLNNLDASDLKGNSYVVFEVLKDESGQVIAEHTDKDSLTQTVSFIEPSIGTVARDKETGESNVHAGPITIVDEVQYQNLDTTLTYDIEGILMDKATNQPLLVDGETVTATKAFSPANTNGTEEIEFTVDASQLKGKDIVVFETLKLNGAVVAEHQDINDAKQTIKVVDPAIGTTLRDEETATQTPSPEEEVTLVDVVQYENLIPDRAYTVKGTLMDKSTEAPLVIDGAQVEAETTFTPETANGEVEVTFTFNAKGLAGQEVVAFESLYTDNKEVAVHTDINDANQTVTFKTPEIGTTATDQNGEKELNADSETTIIDVVGYKDLIAGKEYTLQGILMDKATNAPILVNGEEVHAETTFTPEDTDGSVEVAFTFDASDLYGKDIVVFEKLMRNGKEVVTHEDINDEGQTVFIKNPDIGTTLRDAETGTHSPSPEEDISLVDTVRYENLTPGREYTVKGILMDKSTEAPLLVDGEQVEAETTFTPKTANGEVDVTFTFNAKGLAGQEIVAFET